MALPDSKNRIMISLITTVYNEGKNITAFLSSIARQTLLPDEVVIVDAESTDQTFKLITDFSTTHPELHLKLIKRAGNRSIGRNTAIRNSQYPIIACTDAGCILDRYWLENITHPFKSGNIDVVGGWYETIVKNKWDGALTKVFNFSSGKVNLKTFLPSTRSISFTKKAWEMAGGFDQKLSHNEDTPFAIRLHKTGARFAFAARAIVRWHVAQSFKSLYHTIYRYALGDGQARVYSFHYRLLSAYWISLIVCFGVGFIYPFAWFMGIIILFGYLYLPFLQTKKINSIYEFYLVPLQKLTIIMANTAGFIKGFFTKI